MRSRVVDPTLGPNSRNDVICDTFTRRRQSPPGAVTLARLVTLALAVLIAGCGHKATRGDCEVVVDKNVELQLKALGVTDPGLVSKRREEMRTSMREDIDKCVGKRVTDSMMACVTAAETAEKIDKCLR